MYEGWRQTHDTLKGWLAWLAPEPEDEAHELGTSYDDVMKETDNVLGVFGAVTFKLLKNRAARTEVRCAGNRVRLFYVCSLQLVVAAAMLGCAGGQFEASLHGSFSLYLSSIIGILASSVGVVSALSTGRSYYKLYLITNLWYPPLLLACLYNTFEQSLRYHTECTPHHVDYTIETVECHMFEGIDVLATTCTFALLLLFLMSGRSCSQYLEASALFSKHSNHSLLFVFLRGLAGRMRNRLVARPRSWEIPSCGPVTPFERFCGWLPWSSECEPIIAVKPTESSVCAPRIKQCCPPDASESILPEPLHDSSPAELSPGESQPTESTPPASPPCPGQVSPERGQMLTEAMQNEFRAAQDEKSSERPKPKLPNACGVAVATTSTSTRSLDSMSSYDKDSMESRLQHLESMINMIHAESSSSANTRLRGSLPSTPSQGNSGSSRHFEEHFESMAEACRSEGLDMSQLSGKARKKKRRHQIDIGKSTREYVLYSRLVLREQRVVGNPLHPVTPPVSPLGSKRKFLKQVSDWRRLLHAYDVVPPVCVPPMQAPGCPSIEVRSPYLHTHCAGVYQLLPEQWLGYPVWMASAPMGNRYLYCNGTVWLITDSKASMAMGLGYFRSTSLTPSPLDLTWQAVHDFAWWDDPYVQVAASFVHR